MIFGKIEKWFISSLIRNAPISSGSSARLFDGVDNWRFAALLARFRSLPKLFCKFMDEAWLRARFLDRQFFYLAHDIENYSCNVCCFELTWQKSAEKYVFLLLRNGTLEHDCTSRLSCKVSNFNENLLEKLTWII